LPEKRKDFEEALAAFEKVTELDPQNALAWNNKGAMYCKLGLTSQALQAYRMAIKLARSNSAKNAFKTNLACLLFNLSDYSNADRLVDEILNENPTNTGSLIVKGRICIEERKYDDAEKFLTDACEILHGDPSAILWRAYAKYVNLCFTYNNHSIAFQEGLEQLMRELERTPALIEKKDGDFRINKSTILYLLGYFYFRCGDMYTAKDKLTDSLKYNKNNSAAKELLHNIWNYKMKPSYWQWWLTTPKPLYGIFKIIAFIFICLVAIYFIFNCIATASGSDILLQFTFAQTIITLPAVHIELAQEIVVLTLLMLILLSPNLLYLKTSDVEVHLSQPPDIDLIRALTALEEKIRAICPVYSITTNQEIISETAVTEQFKYKI